MSKTEATKKHIVSKAMEVFNTKGYNATSLSDITKATGLTKGAIYGNFENKDAVAVASFEHAINIVMGELTARIKSQPSAPLKLLAIIEYYEEYIHNPPVKGGCPMMNTAIEADDNYPELKARVVRTIDMIQNSIEKIVHRGVLEGQLSKIKVEEFATTFFATIEGAVIISRLQGDMRTYQLISGSLKKEIETITLK